MHMAIACQTDQKFEKFQMTPDVSELVSGVVAGVNMAGNGVAGVFAGGDAAVPFCGGTNIWHTNLRPSCPMTGIDGVFSFAGLHLSSFSHVYPWLISASLCAKNAF
jgi:hypothetical protein